MRKIIGAIAVTAILLTAGVAAACDHCWSGHGPGYRGGANSVAMQKFHKDTLGLRDDLAQKRVDLAVEHDKAQPDTGRIAAIRKDIIDLEAKVQAAADKHGVRQGGHGHGRWMAEGRGGCGCW